MTHHELPPEKHQKLVKAIRLEWVSILYLLSAIVVLYFTVGNSQAMKAALAEDILSPLPRSRSSLPRVRRRSPNDKFPYGYHRVTSIAFLCADEPGRLADRGGGHARGDRHRVRPVFL